MRCTTRDPQGLLLENKVGQKILDSTGKELNRSHRLIMIIANESMQVIEGKVELRTT